MLQTFIAKVYAKKTLDENGVEIPYEFIIQIDGLNEEDVKNKITKMISNNTVVMEEYHEVVNILLSDPLKSTRI